MFSGKLNGLGKEVTREEEYFSINSDSLDFATLLLQVSGFSVVERGLNLGPAANELRRHPSKLP